jgi:cellulose synthase/poly-beta-1,6-N-acetylglucosamine synthase-like glycosyltransferase
MITIGIAAYREPKIENSIQTVINQKLRENYEIVVVCPDEETATIVKQMAKKNKHLRLIKEAKREGQPAAYNKIIKAAKGRIIIFTDADAKLGEGAIQRTVDAYNDKQVGAAGGRPLPVNPRTDKFGFWAHYLFEMGHKLRKRQVEEGNFYYISGPLCSIRSGTIKEVPTNALATDAVLGLTVKSKGWKIVYVPDAVVYQKAPTTVSDYFKQKRRTMAGFYQLRQWFPKVKTRSLASEASGGFLSGLSYAKNIKELFWFLELAFLRTVMWTLAFYDIVIRKKGLVELWQPISTSK